MQTKASKEPFLSVVATSRNDNHGGDLTRRTQVFVDSLAAQANRHELAIELILVEWNPPPDRQPLAAELHWPASSKFFDGRVITVPAAEHAKFDPESRLPLYQMIGKNVGIRRARGTFVLSTNIDLIFSDELFRELRNNLKAGCLYRADRYDIDASVPLDASIEAKLLFSKSHILRIHKADGTYLLSNGRWTNTESSPLAKILVNVRHGLLDAGRHVKWRIEKFGGWFARHARQLAMVVLPGAALVRVYRHAHARLRNQPVPYSPLDDIARYRYNEIVTARRWLNKYRRLHTNGCGDFTLMDRNTWFRFRGYPEWVLYSWHIDSVFLVQLEASNIPAQIFRTQACAYHIEHGGGWTPESQAILFERLRARGVSFLSNSDFFAIEAELERNRGRRKPVVFNDENWGLADLALPETELYPLASHPSEAKAA